MKKIFLILLCIGMVVYSCKEDTELGQQPLDSIAPGKVTDVSVENIAGGAVLSYKLPDDEDLLYVKAEYEIKEGETSEVKASLYCDTLTIEGFGDTLSHQVQVYAVDRSKNESEPVTVTITPQTPAVTTIGRSVEIVRNFGGVLVTWENSTQAKVSIIVMTDEENAGEYKPVETFYSSTKTGEESVTGMDTIQYNFAYYVMDRWENTSEIKYDTITPLFETEFDNDLFEAVDLASDGEEYSAWPKENMWDGIWANNSGYSTTGGTGVWPQAVTVDLGVTGKISRFRLYQRMGDYTFAEGNPRLFQIYGCTGTPQDDWDTWTLLMDCESIKPSGSEIGTNTDEDIEVATNGEDFYNDADDPAVRYIRILVTKTWGEGDNFQITEFKVYGDNR